MIIGILVPVTWQCTGTKPKVDGRVVLGTVTEQVEAAVDTAARTIDYGSGPEPFASQFHPLSSILRGFADAIEFKRDGGGLACAACQRRPYPSITEDHTVIDRLFEGAGNTCAFSFLSYKLGNELGVDDVALEKRCVAIIDAYEKRTGAKTSWDGTSADAVRTVLEDERLLRILEGVIAEEELGVQPRLIEDEIDPLLDLTDEDEVLVADEDLIVDTATRQPWPTNHEREPYGSCREPGIPCLCHSALATYREPYWFGVAIGRGWLAEHFGREAASLR